MTIMMTPIRLFLAHTKTIFTGETLSYTNFLGGQPDNAGGVQDCLIVSPSFAGWDDVSCASARPCYVCEYANE